MKVCIDARRLLQEDDPTWPYYLSSLINALQGIDRVNEYVLFFNFCRKRYADILNRYSFGGNFRARTLRIPHKVFENVFATLHVPINAFIGRADVVHSPVYACFNNPCGKSVATIHDLIFFRNPEHVAPGWLKFAKRNTDYAVKKADILITISEFSKREIMEHYKITGDRIRVIHNGVGKEFSQGRQGIDVVRDKYGIKGKYLLHVGAIDPRKNLVSLIRAYHRLPIPFQREYKLALVGVRRYGSDEVFNEVRELGMSDNVIFTGRVPREDLPFLYAGAELFVFPSLSEGFGLPLLEAMACGTPVIASNSTSVPEVTGDAALLVDPRMVDEIAAAIFAVLSDPAVRAGLRSKGLERAGLFSWERAARETLAVYRELQ